MRIEGAARAGITPLEANPPTQLGGYGDRAGKPAEGVHDTLWAKALVFDFGGEISAVLTNDHIGYILTAGEYAKSGYEVTASFYGPGLADTLLAAAGNLARTE